MKLILILIVTLLLNSCIPESNNKYLTYQNLIILSDMSDRISNKDFPEKDILEIKKIIQYFEKECVKPGEKIGDKSSIHFSPFSQKNIFSVDLDKIVNLGDKQSFINSTGKYELNGLKEKLLEFEKIITQKYGSINDKGIDLLSILLEKIQNENMIKKDKIITDGIDTTFVSYENHIYILTDGYLEYTLKTDNHQFRFGPSKIIQLRTYCKKNNINVENALTLNTNLGLIPIKNELNKYINIHVLETHERDFNKKTQNYDNQIGYRDNEILEQVWKKWINESGFKNFEWERY
ncbi:MULTISPECIES: hypothetical protein [Flavobacterium]|uniref:Uncharacterized protein n=1 Tax=Flavobacterium jumunjinense TaxID=998845 RepID=A0ABV5GTJ6_9FLAO|nr:MULTISPECIES: hypothetical protein [Flavobacterium]